MADLTITDANVELANESGVVLRTVPLGETIGRSEPVYESNGKAYKADNTDATKSAVTGITLLGGDLDDYAIIITSGKFKPGATLVAGSIYVVSDTAGKIAPNSDLGSGDFVTLLGVAIDTETLDVGIDPKAIAIA